MLQAKKQRGQCIHKGRRKSEIVRDRIVLIHVIDLCISPRSAGETFLAEFLKKEQRFCARSSMHSAAGHGSISSSRRSSRRAGEMFSRFHTAQAGTVSFSSGIKVRFLWRAAEPEPARQGWYSRRRKPAAASTSPWNTQI